MPAPAVPFPAPARLLRRLALASAAPLALAGCMTMPAPVEVAAAPPIADTPASAPAPAGKAQLGDNGFDLAGMDRSVKPGDDMYAFANGAWARATPIPADKSNYGMFGKLDDLSKDRTKALLEELRGTDSRVGHAYASFLDEAAVEAKGLAPIQPWLTRIRGLTNRADLPALLADAARHGVPGLVYGYVGQDDKAPDTYIFSMGQGGLGMPDRDYYLSNTERFKSIRTAYKAHLAAMLAHAGEADATARAARLYALEEAIARAHWDKNDSSDATKTYNKLSVAELDRRTPGLGLAAMLTALGVRQEQVLVAQPSAFEGIARAVAAADLGTVRDLLIVRSLDAYADQLPDRIAKQNFAFYNTTLSGTPEMQPRWKRGVDFATGILGDDIGREYVARYYPPETKAKMDTLVANVLAAMGRRIDALDWMQPATKARARVKLANFTTKVGYPTQWKDYSALEVKGDDLFGNAWRANAWAFADNLSKLGQPIRKWEWFMTPMTVNAYANFGMNEIVFPAAILQPPFFDPAADPAYNYGGIGAVIGHEVSHHFDDQGAKYDENGRLADWWTPADVAAFEKAGEALIKQYGAYEVLPGLKLDGKFTLGENIGDLAGLAVAYDAYRASLNGAEAPVIDGLTGDQRFFLGWAQVWRRNYREANLAQRVTTDPHSPSIQRVWVSRNLDPWYAAFNVTADQRLYLPPEERVRIW